MILDEENKIAYITHEYYSNNEEVVRSYKKKGWMIQLVIEF